MRRRPFLLAATIALLIPAGAALAAVVCRTGGGTLKVREVCKRRETQVDPVALGFKGEDGMKGDKGDKGNTGATGEPGQVDPSLVYRTQKTVNGNPSTLVCGTLGCTLGTDLLLDCEATGGTDRTLTKIGRKSDDDSICEACAFAGPTVTAGSQVLAMTAVCYPSVTTTTTTTTSTTTTTTTHTTTTTAGTATTTTATTSTTSTTGGGGGGTTTTHVTTTVTTSTATTTTVPTTSTTTTTLGCCAGATRLSFTTTPGSGACGQVTSLNGTKLRDISCGGLYFGGGQNTVPLPALVPDLGISITKITACNGQSATLANATSAETGSNQTCTSVNCLFGAPLPIPNAGSPPTSTCVVNKVATNASGTANCTTGDANIMLPLTSEIFLTGDLLPTVPDIQPCPLCTGTPATCKGGARDGLPCMPGTTALNTSYPTSQDCLPLAATDIGGLPIGFNLTSGPQTKEAVATASQARVFCGFCRDSNSGCFQGDHGAACPSHTGGAKSCTTEAQCTTAPFTDCGQRNNGAFGPGANGARTITATGAPAGNLNDKQPHASKLVSIFCIPPTFNPTVDAAADLPGPGATALQGTTRVQ